MEISITKIKNVVESLYKDSANKKNYIIYLLVNFVPISLIIGSFLIIWFAFVAADDLLDRSPLAVSLMSLLLLFFCIFVFITYVAMIVLSMGYVYEFMSYYRKTGKIVFPALKDIKGKLISGVKYFFIDWLIYVAYFILVIIILTLTVIIFSVIPDDYGYLIPMVFLFWNIFVYLAMFLPLVLWNIFVHPVILYRYMKNGYKDLFNIKEITEALKISWKDFAIIGLIMYAIMYVLSFAMYIPCIGYIIYLFAVPIFPYVYGVLLCDKFKEIDEQKSKK